jgi:dsDNA-specific endonuclease/ATPase MutS2
MNECPELKSYKRKDVDDFLLKLNAEHIRALMEKDDEIKRLYSECEYYRQESAGKDEIINKMKAEYEAKLEASRREAESVNARLGEKISAAEKAASVIISDARTEKEKIVHLAKAEADSYIAQTKAKADEYCEKAKQLASVYRDHQQKALQSLDIMNKHLDGAVEEVNKLYSGAKK